MPVNITNWPHGHHAHSTADAFLAQAKDLLILRIVLVLLVLVIIVAINLQNSRAVGSVWSLSARMSWSGMGKSRSRTDEFVPLFMAIRFASNDQIAVRQYFNDRHADRKVL